jgi:membrane fusion protein (multidrug efflux system)
VRVGSIVLWTVLVCAIVAGVLLGVFKKPEQEQSVVAEKATAVSVMDVVPRTVPDSLRVPGRVEPFADVTLAAELGASVETLTVDRGATVRKGQTLLTLDSALRRAYLDRARIEVREAEKALTRWERLKETGAVSDSDYDAIRTRLDVARVTLKEAEIGLAKCTLVSPVDGTVEDRFVETGEYVNEGQAVLRVVDTTRLKVQVEIPEREIPAVRMGQKLQLAVGALDDTEVTGVVSFVSASGRRESNCFSVELIVEEPPERLRPGMIADVQIVRRNWEDAVVVPLGAIVPRKGDYVAFVAETTGDVTRARSRIVRIEKILGDLALLEQGLVIGESLVVEGQRSLQDGQLVEVHAD